MLTIPTRLKQIRRITPSPKGRYAVLEDEDILSVWDFQDSKLLFSKYHQMTTKPLFRDDHELFYAERITSGLNKAHSYPHYHLHDLITDSSTALPACHLFGFDPETRKMIGFRYDVGAVVFDPAQEANLEIRRLLGQKIESFVDGFYFHESNSLMIVDGAHDVLNFYLFDSTSFRKVLEAKSSFQTLLSLTASNTEAFLAGVNTTKILIWETAAIAKPPRVFQNTTRRNFTGIAFDATGRYLLSASNDAAIKVWDVASGEIVRDYDFGQGRMRSIAVAPDGLTALAGTDKGVVVQFDLDL
ncbi:MAG: WD40 repeat domain-containing protein [Fimbriiglobus sp.]